MPVYEWKCSKCGTEFEMPMKITDDTKPECPGCGSKDHVEKQISKSTFQLKGGGWSPSGYSS